MKAFHERLRFEYQLNQDSLVLDLGAYDGMWSKEIYNRYRCRIFAFEPVPEYFANAVCNCIDTAIVLINSCVAATGAMQSIGISNNSSGKFSVGAPTQVSVVRVQPLIVGLGHIDLCKMNVEGMEYELLEILLWTGLHKRIYNLQIQFHNCVPDWENKYNKICSELNLTHEPEWDSGPTWQNWKLR